MSAGINFGPGLQDGVGVSILGERNQHQHSGGASGSAGGTWGAAGSGGLRFVLE